MALVEKQSVNPRWVLSGDGDKYLAACSSINATADALKLVSLQELLQTVVERCLDKLAEEIVRKSKDN